MDAVNAENIEGYYSLRKLHLHIAIFVSRFSLSRLGIHMHCIYTRGINSLHAEIVCTSAIINAEINVICLRVKVSSVA